MNFEQWKQKIEELDCNAKESLTQFVDAIDISEDNFDAWVDYVYSDKIFELNLEKLPYVIDELYQTNDKYLFILCCMLIESTCEKLPFITNLEQYPMFKAKYETLKGTLVKVYDMVDNGIANCMALILLHNDPAFTLLDEKEKMILTKATIRKLKEIIRYLKKTMYVNPAVYDDLEIIIDLSIYLESEEVERLIGEIATLTINDACLLFITKYQLIHEKEISEETLERLLQDKTQIDKVIAVFEDCDAIDKIPEGKVKQEEIAKASMIHWLMYPTELGKEPDEIELIDTFTEDGYQYYLFKFKSESYSVKDYMLGLDGGYMEGELTAKTNGMTFSKFEALEENYMEQAKGIMALIRESQEQQGLS